MGRFAAPAKELIAQLGGSVSTTFTNPNAPAEEEEVSGAIAARGA